VTLLESPLNEGKPLSTVEASGGGKFD
jgi:hypothetical protein